MRKKDHRGYVPTIPLKTKLEKFLRMKDIKPAWLARESGYSRQHLLALRLGTTEATRRCIAAITAACRRLSGEDIDARDLFDLDVSGSVRDDLPPPDEECHASRKSYPEGRKK